MALNYKIVPVTPLQQNCSLLWCDETNEGAVVDPGGEIERILGEVEGVGFKLVKILLTHAHIDHAGATKTLADQQKLPIEGPHKEDNFWIKLLPQQAGMFGFPAAEVFTPDRWLEDGETLSVGNQTLDVIHCPGHTPGHVVFYHKESKLAVVGDVLFAGSIGRTDFPKGDHPTLINAIRNKLLPLGDDIEFIPGHGPMSTFGNERQHNPFVADSVVG